MREEMKPFPPPYDGYKEKKLAKKNLMRGNRGFAF
jgi:hypothetical protein